MNYCVTEVEAFIIGTPLKLWTLKCENEDRKLKSPIDSQTAELTLPCWNVKLSISEMLWKKPVVTCFQMYRTKMQKWLQNDFSGMAFYLEVFTHP